MTAQYSKTKTAIITTLWYLPALLWQQMFIAMYLQEERHPDYFEPLTLAIFIMMVAVTFITALKSERINKNRIHTLSIIVLTIGVVLVFDKNVYAQLGFFFLYNYVLIYPLKEFIRQFSNGVPEFEVWMDDNEDSMGNNRYVEDEELNYFIESFYTFEEATKFIEEKVDTVIADMASKVRNVEELKSMEPTQQVSYFIKTKSVDKVYFRTYDYIQKRADDIFKKLNINNFEDLLKRGNLPDDDRVASNWLKIKNKQFDDVDVSKNNIEDILSLNDSEFKEFLFETSNQRVVFLFLSTLCSDDLQKFYTYIEKFKAGASQDFKENVKIFKNQDIKHHLLADATLRTKLYLLEAKRTFILNVGTYNEMQDALYDSNSKAIMDFEHSFDTIIYGEIKKVRTSFKDNLVKLKTMYKNKEVDDMFCKHIVYRFGYLMMALNNLVINIEDDEFEWFLYPFFDKDSQINSEDTFINQIIYHLTMLFQALSKNDLQEFLSSYIKIIKIQITLYPLYKQSTLINLEDMLKFIGSEEVNIENANTFLELFESIPKIYENTSYENIIDLKDVINKSISTYKPLDNKVFDEDGVKNKLILLSYLVDMEDLYYESGLEKEEGL